LLRRCWHCTKGTAPGLPLVLMNSATTRDLSLDTLRLYDDLRADRLGGNVEGAAVIGSAAGGIIDQIAEGAGILLPEPADPAAFGSAARLLLGDQAQAARAGQAACPRPPEACRRCAPAALRLAARHPHRLAATPRSPAGFGAAPVVR